MSNERDALARIIMSPESFDGGPVSSGPNSVYAARTAEAILAAGYRKFSAESAADFVAEELRSKGWVKPRQVSTVAELDALGFQSVVLDAYGTPYVCERHRTDGTRNEWKPSGMGHLDDSDTILYRGPATVLHEGATE